MNDFMAATIVIEVGKQPMLTLRENNGAVVTRPVSLNGIADVLQERSIPPIMIKQNCLATNIFDVIAFWQQPKIQEVLLTSGSGKEKDHNIHAVPMPGLVMKFRTPGTISVVAHKGRKRPAPGTLLYRAPLPNIDNSEGGVCLGTTQLIEDCPFAADIDPEAAWSAFWGSSFNGHSAGGKCYSYPKDVRLLLLDLQDKNRFPESDLVPLEMTFEQWLHDE